MEPKPVDVVVVGGGPAGLAAAVVLGKRGVRVRVVERSTWPRDKVCGEGLMPTGAETLKRMGVFERIDRRNLRPFEGIRWISEDGTTAEARFASGPGFGIRRTALSRALFEAAVALPSVELWSSTRLLGMEVLPDRAKLSVRREGRTVSIESRLVIGADGRNSQVRRLAGLDGDPEVSLQRWGAREHFEVEPWSDHVEVFWAEGMEAYVTPSGPRQVEVAFLWDKARYKPTRKGRHLVAGLLEEFPALRARLGRNLPRSLSRAAGIGPLALGAERATADRILLVGDALGYVDGITGEGISVALTQVESLEKSLPKLIEQDRLLARDLRPMGRQVERLFRETVPLVKAALLLSRFPTLRRLAVHGLRNAKPLFVHLLEANMGKRPLLRAPLGSVVRFVWGAMKWAVGVRRSPLRPELLDRPTDPVKMRAG